MRIRKWISFIGILSILSTFVVGVPVATAASDDYKKCFDKWAWDAIDEAEERGLIDTSLKCDNSIVNRAVGYLMLTQGFGVYSETAASPLKDLVEDWYRQAFHTAYTLGWTAGVDGKGLPGNTFTRAQMSVAVAAVLGLEDGTAADLAGYTDVTAKVPSDWAVGPMAAMVKAKLIGQGGVKQLRPNDGVSKAETIVILNAAVTYAETEEIDVTEVSAVRQGVDVDALTTGLEEGLNYDSVSKEWVAPEEVVAEEEEEEEEEVAEEEEEEEEVAEEEEGETPVVVAPAGELAVALAPTSPAAQDTIVAGQSIARLADFVFTNGGDAAIKVTNVKLKRLGVSADTTLTRVYLYEGAKRLTDDASVSDGVITWSNSEGIFTVPAKGASTIAVKSNIAAGTNGQTVIVSIGAATDITSNAASLTGTFPVKSNVVTIASATLATFAFGTAVTPTTNASLDPQNDYTAWQNTVTVGQRAVNFKSMNFRVIGSIVLSDLKNFKLYIDGVQIGETVASADANGYVLFDLSNAPKKLETGSRVFKINADVIGGSSRNFQLSLRQAADTLVEDVDYNAAVLVTGDGTATTNTYAPHTAGLQTVSSGTLTVSKRTVSPSGNVVNNGSGVILGTFDLKALGEKMKVENLRVAVVDSGANTVYTLRNGALYINSGEVGQEDAFTQIGSTAAIAATTDLTLAYTEFSLGSSLVVEPGKDRILQVRADVFDSDGTNNISAGATITAQIAIGSTNVQALVSATYSSVPATAVSANALTIATGVLALAKDQGYLNQSVVAPQTNFLLGKWTLTAGSTEAVNLSTLQIDLTPGNTFAVTDLNNLYIKYGSSTTSLKATGAATQSWSFSKTIEASGNLVIELYGDIAAAASDGGGDDTMIASLLVSGTTASSATTVNTNSNAVLGGQTITAQNAGTLTVAKDANTPLSAIVTPGSTPDAGALKVKLTAANEDVYVKDLVFRQTVNANDVAVTGAYLYVAHGSGVAAQVGAFKTFDIDGTNPGFLKWSFSGIDRIKVAKSSSSYLVLRPTYVSSQNDPANASGETPQFVLNEIRAEGQSTITPTIVEDGTAVTVNLAAATTASTCLLNGNVTDAATTITIDTCNNTNGAFIPVGMLIQIDNEAMFVTAVPTATTLTVTRGSAGTTAAAHTDTNQAINLRGDLIASTSQTKVVTDGPVGTTVAVGKSIEIENELMLVTAINVDPLGGGGVVDYLTVVRESDTVATHAAASGIDGAFQGNAMTVYRTAPTVTTHASTPTGAATGGSAVEMMRFTVAAANNISDPGEDKVTLTSVDITIGKSGVSVNNIVIYPIESAYDKNTTYRTTCNAESQTKWLCTMNTTSATNEIIENTSRSYKVYGDVGSGAGTSNTLEVSIASLGTSGAAGDVVWSDQTTSSLTWVDQGMSQVKPIAPLTYGANSGTNDAAFLTTGLAILLANGSAADSIDTLDTIRLTFPERIDPTSINASLLPTGAYTVTGVLAASTGGVTGNNADAIVTVTNITTFDLGATLAAAASFTTDLMLDTTGTILTIRLNTGTARVIGVPTSVAGTSVAGTVKDVNNNAMGANATALPTGSL